MVLPAVLRLENARDVLWAGPGGTAAEETVRRLTALRRGWAGGARGEHGADGLRQFVMSELIDQRAHS